MTAGPGGKEGLARAKVVILLSVLTAGPLESRLGPPGLPLAARKVIRTRALRPGEVWLLLGAASPPVQQGRAWAVLPLPGLAVPPDSWGSLPHNSERFAQIREVKIQR